MKKILTAAILMAAIGGFAQEKAPIKQAGGKIKTEKTEKKEHKVKVTPDEQSKQLAKELNLNDVQQAKVKSLYEEQEKARAKNPDLVKMEKGEQHDHAAMAKKMKEENTAFETKMKGILSKDQYTTWKASTKKGHEMHEGKPEALKKA